MFPSYKQLDAKDCGATCLKIVAKYYGKTLSVQQLRELSETTRNGVNLHFLALAAESIHLRSLPAKISFEQLKEAPLPCILHWDHNHFVVLYKVKRNTFYLSDPSVGLIKLGKEDFIKHWVGQGVQDDAEEGIVLLLEPTLDFNKVEYNPDTSKRDLGFVFGYIKKYKTFIMQLGLGLLAGSILQLIFPFLTQSIVDIGIQNQDLHFVYLILMAQLFLFLGKISIELIRSWILLHLGSRINISILSDFFIKLMRLPMAFFDTRLTGDLMLRMEDHERVEKLLTTSSLNVLFSLVNILLFSFILMYYNLSIFIVFIMGSLIYVGWILLFQKKHRILDHQQFMESARERSKVIELIGGMQDIKLHNAEQQFRWDWEHIQARLFKISIASMTWNQYQSIGSGFINELKNILITILAAKLVIDGSMTLGMMLAVSYIIGQLNAPLLQLVDFIRDLQGAQISIERLSSIHHMEDEPMDLLSRDDIHEPSDIKMKDVTFRYNGVQKPTLLDINLTIPKNKITAIVGVSGSGKTTLMKLLLKFYALEKGSIKLGDKDLASIPDNQWRSSCGVVMQEGYIFSNTITRNIAMDDAGFDNGKLRRATKMANIDDFIESLPLGYNTIIGAEGLGLSTGQKQRILIARAIYKNPSFLFFDEATSALDANNEKAIMESMQSFFENKTVVLIAHRLSTVKQADQIILLEQGMVKEVGTHDKLIAIKGGYFNLVKNQLELGN